MSKVTADTIKDEELRRLIQDADRMASDARFALLHICSPHGSTHPSPATANALERCAVAWNALHGDQP